MSALDDYFNTASVPPLLDLEDHRLLPSVIEALRNIRDPEITENIYDLGLIYRIDIGDLGDKAMVDIDMTVSRGTCPVADDMPKWVRTAIEKLDGVGMVNVNVVYDPPWTLDRASEAGRIAMNLL